MKRVGTIAIIITAIVFFLVPTRAAMAFTAAEMLSHCAEVVNARHMPGSEGRVNFDPNFQSGICWGAFSAIQDLIVIAWSGEASPILNICAPPASTLLQFVRIFDAYARAHPEKQHRDFGEIAFEALSASFRCSPATPATTGNR